MSAELCANVMAAHAKDLANLGGAIDAVDSLVCNLDADWPEEIREKLDGLEMKITHISCMLHCLKEIAGIACSDAACWEFDLRKAEKAD